MTATPVVENLIGHFIIKGMLGKGGTALVYKALDRRTDTIVALKVLHYHLASEPDVMARFQRESKIVQSLHHPNIVPIYDSGEIDGYTYLAMRYMSGGSLAGYFRNPINVNFITTLEVLRQVADALDFAHSREVIHRDLKLENILLDENGECYLSDFGIARAATSTRFTATGLAPGTPHYMSPEQAMGRNDLDYRSDLYSMAVMAYLMLVGCYPFTGEDPLVILNKHISMSPPVPRDVNSNLSPAASAVLLRGLSKAPEDRHETAGEFVEQLERALKGFTSTTVVNVAQLNPVAAQPIVEVVPAMIPAPVPTTAVIEQRRRRNPLFLLLLLVTVFLSMGLLWYIGTEGLPGAQQPPVDSAALVNDALTQTATGWTQTPAESSLMDAESTEEPTSTSTAGTLSVTGTVTSGTTRTPAPTLTHSVSASLTPSTQPTRIVPSPTVNAVIPTSTPQSQPTSVPPTNASAPTSAPQPTSVPPTSVPPTNVPPTNPPPTDPGLLGPIIDLIPTLAGGLFP